MPATKSRRRPARSSIKAPSFKPGSIPLLELDPAPRAIIDPTRHKRLANFPKRCVLCFFQDVIDDLVRNGAREIDRAESEGGLHPVYEVEIDGKRLAVAHPRVGAPNAVGMLERCIARGSRKFVVCGGAGVLHDGVAVGNVIVPSSAVRDEGTSYHYLPPAREIGPHPQALRTIQSVLRRNAVDYIEAKTWTTDAFYRETRGKVLMRRTEGCLTVEMEASALFAVAKFRRVMLAQILYAGDSLGGRRWDHRNWMRHQARELVFRLAAESCLRM
jgi:uridine phosphorylase